MNLDKIILTLIPTGRQPRLIDTNLLVSINRHSIEIAEVQHFVQKAKGLTDKHALGTPRTKEKRTEWICWRKCRPALADLSSNPSNIFYPPGPGLSKCLGKTNNLPIRQNRPVLIFLLALPKQSGRNDFLVIGPGPICRPLEGNRNPHIIKRTAYKVKVEMVDSRPRAKETVATISEMVTAANDDNDDYID